MAEHRGGENGDLERRDGVSRSPASTDVSEVDASFDYLALKSRFFAAIWDRLGLDFGSDVSFADAAPARSSCCSSREEPPLLAATGGGGPAWWARLQLEQSVVAGGGKPHILRVQATGLNKTPLAPTSSDRPSLRLVILVPMATCIAIPEVNPAHLAWAITITSMRSEDFEPSPPPNSVWNTPTDSTASSACSPISLPGCSWPLAAIPGVGYGLGVILLTILIKGALHRTTFKQQKSMMGMQKLGPELKAHPRTI